jgi:RES domain-containing protein
LRLFYRVRREKYARNPFDGEGAYRYGGRWSSPGIRLSYASEHQSLAMLEYFVHLDKDDPPDDLVLAVAEVPNDLTAERVELAALPRNWFDAAAPPELARFGDEFAQRREHCLFLVPSVLAPGENNCLLNPDHPDFKRIVIRSPQPLSYDRRMFGERHARRKRRAFQDG